MVDLGLQAEFIAGDTDQERHAWVVFEWRNGKKYLFETTAKHGKMIFPIDVTENLYLPEFSVDQNLKTYRYRASSSARSSSANRQLPTGDCRLLFMTKIRQERGDRPGSWGDVPPSSRFLRW